MKKFCCFVLAFLFGMICFVPIFAMHTKEDKTFAASFSEDLLEDKFDIVSPDNKNVLFSTADLNNSPLDPETNKMQPGYTITPNADKYAQTNVTFSVNEFEANENKSVYMWIYFADELLYSLEIAFNGPNGNVIKWGFSSGELRNLISDNDTKAVAYGWRLFELKFSDAILNNNISNVDGLTFSTMSISYDSGLTSGLVETTKGISFYHVYMAESYSAVTDIVYYQNYANFKVKDNFSSVIGNMFIYDELKLSGPYDVFEYVVIGKYDLKNYSNLKDYTWSILIQDENGAFSSLKFGDSFVFENEGWYSLNIQLIEDIGASSDVVLNSSHSLYCTKFTIGAFSKANYFFEKDSKNSISFTFTSNFVSESDIRLTVSDKKLVDTTYYIEDNVCYITVTAKKEGCCTIKIEVDGHRAGSDNVSETYTSMATIFVNDSGYDSISVWILIVVFAGFCLALATFLIISLVKARKFGVK